MDTQLCCVELLTLHDQSQGTELGRATAFLSIRLQTERTETKYLTRYIYMLSPVISSATATKFHQALIYHNSESLCF